MTDLSWLTQREREVMEEVCKGNATKVIGGLLGLSPRTVDVHRANVMRKLHAHNQTHAAILFDRARRSEPAPWSNDVLQAVARCVDFDAWEQSAPAAGEAQQWYERRAAALEKANMIAAIAMIAHLAPEA